MIKNDVINVIFLVCVAMAMAIGFSGTGQHIATVSGGVDNSQFRLESSHTIIDRNCGLLCKQQHLTEAKAELLKYRAQLAAAEARKYRDTFDMTSQHQLSTYDPHEYTRAITAVEHAEQRLLTAESEVAFAVTMTKYQGMYDAALIESEIVSPSLSTMTITRLIEQY